MRVLIAVLGGISLVVGTQIGMTPGGGLLVGVGFGGVMLATFWPRS
jgi:hypothetical protein